MGLAEDANAKPLEAVSGKTRRWSASSSFGRSVAAAKGRGVPAGTRQAW